MAKAIHYCGHMFAAHHPEEVQLRARVDDALHENDVRMGVGALACGADIIFAEALLHTGADLHVVLPFASDQFVTRSVLIGGAAWRARYHLCFAAAKTVQIMASDIPGDPFANAAALAMRTVLEHATLRALKPLQIALSDGSAPSGNAGTAADVRAWQVAGGQSRLIAMPARLRLSQTSKSAAQR